MPQYFCPECENEIDHLQVEGNYSEYGRFWGSTSPIGDDLETQDSDCSESSYDDREYTCPECENGIDLNNVREVTTAEEQQRRSLFRPPQFGVPRPDPVIDPRQNAEPAVITENKRQMSDIEASPSPYRPIGQIAILKCEKCGNENPLGEGETEIECTQCNKTLKQKEGEKKKTYNQQIL